MAENIVKHIFSVDPTADKKNRRSGVRREGRGKGIGSFHVSKSRRQYEINKSIITELERNSYFHFEMRFPMWAMSIKDFIAKYDKPGAILDSHDDLRAEGLLQKVPLDEKKDVIFVSHEWYDIDHPDPDGIKLGHLCSSLRRFMKGEITAVNTHWKEYLLFQDDTTEKPTNADSWKEYFESAYIWFDYISMPQPVMHRLRGNKKKTREAEKKLRLAASSVASYIDYCSLMLVLAPSVVLKSSSTGKRRIVDFATWRSRGWCMLELFCSQFNVGKIKDSIVISEGYRGKPYRLSRGYVLNIQPLMANFTCCESGLCKMNHYCDKVVALKTIHAIIDRRVEFGLEMEKVTKKFTMVSIQNVRNFRYLMALKGHYCRSRNLNNETSCSNLMTLANATSQRLNSSPVSSSDVENVKVALQSIREKLGLLTIEDELESYRSRDIDIISFTILSNNLPCLKLYLKEKLKDVTSDTLRKEIVSNVREILTPFGGANLFTIRTSSLMLAMGFGSPEMVKFLIESGADHNVTGKRGADGLDFACIFCRVENILMWLEKFPKYFEKRRVYSPLFTSILVPGPMTIKVVETLIAMGQDVTDTFQFDLTLLHTLSIPGNIDMKLCAQICRAVYVMSTVFERFVRARSARTTSIRVGLWRSLEKVKTLD